MAVGSRYSDEHRRRAVALYLLHGNWRRVSELTRIPERALKDWSIQPWFGTMLAELRAEKARELDGTYTRILDEATAQILDRLKYGDPYIVGGEVKRKPVSARDLALVAAITYDKRQLSRVDHLELQNATKPIPLDKLATLLERYADEEIIPEMRCREAARLALRPPEDGDSIDE